MTPSTLAPTDRLHRPHARRTVLQYGDNAEGRRELRLFHGELEISFDEPELFTFGETLAQRPCFAAGEALHWGEPGPWPRVRSLLEQLVDAGLLQRLQAGSEGDEAEAAVRGEAGARPSPLPPARSTRPRSWNEGPALMAELTGRPLETGWLELVVPIFRVAHMALDAEGRQVGEANVFPPQLRLDLPTRWRTCIYAGSRHLHEQPMNVTALKAMRAHWGPMMALLLQVREAYLRRCPEAREGWTVGHLERLSTAVLALPAYQLMRRQARVADGALHPVLSSMFRVTDGLRMTMHDMLFIPFGEPTRHPESPMDAAEVLAFAERAFSFISTHGVCAGPRAMVEEFLAVLVDGQAPRDGLPEALAPELQAAVADIEPALDYGLRGLKAYAAVFSLWPMTMRAYEALHALAQAWAAAEPQPVVLALQARLQPIVDTLRGSTHLATEAWRADRERVYGDMYAQCERALCGQGPEQALAERLLPAVRPGDAAARAALAAALEAHFGGAAAGAPHRAACAAALMDYFRRARAVVRLGCEMQADINRLLGREAPTRRFEAADIDLYVQLTGETEGRVPFLLDELRELMGLRVAIDADTLAVEGTTVPA